MSGYFPKLINRYIQYRKLYVRCSGIVSHPYSQVATKPLGSESIPEPVYEGENKIYPDKIVKLVNQISSLTLIEVADLNQLLKRTLNLPDAPMMQAASALVVSSPQEEEAVSTKQEKTSFTVRIIKFDESRKVALIKEVKNLVPGMNLVQAKKFVESSPSVVRTDAAKDEAEKLKESLAAVGAIVEID